MTRTSLFDPFPANPFKPGSQNHTLYERLKDGPVSNRDIMRMCIPKYTGRISEIREMLRPHQLKIKAITVGDRSHVTYMIVGCN